MESVVDLKAIWIIKSAVYMKLQRPVVFTGVGIEKGRILTCSHGFEKHRSLDGRKIRSWRISARRVHEEKFYDLEVVVQRPEWDLCILKFLGQPPTDLKHLKISDDEVLKVGEEIHLIGHGKNLVASTYTGNVLYPCIKRDPSSKFTNHYPYENVNPNIPVVSIGGMWSEGGASGGPYVKNGEVIAIHMSSIGDYFDFGVHVSAIKEIVKEADLKEGGLLLIEN